MDNTGFWWGIGNAIRKTFFIIDELGNLPNIIFVLIFIALLIYWTYKLHDLQNKARKGIGKM